MSESIISKGHPVNPMDSIENTVSTNTNTGPWAGYESATTSFSLVTPSRNIARMICSSLSFNSATQAFFGIIEMPAFTVKVQTVPKTSSMPSSFVISFSIGFDRNDAVESNTTFGHIIPVQSRFFNFASTSQLIDWTIPGGIFYVSGTGCHSFYYIFTMAQARSGVNINCGTLTLPTSTMIVEETFYSLPGTPGSTIFN